MNKIIGLTLFLILFSFNLQASLFHEFKTDEQKFDELRDLIKKEKFAKGCLDLEATILVSTIEDHTTRISATILVHSAQIKGLRSEAKKQRSRIEALEKKCCVIQ